MLQFKQCLHPKSGVFDTDKSVAACARTLERALSQLQRKQGGWTRQLERPSLNDPATSIIHGASRDTELAVLEWRAQSDIRTHRPQRQAVHEELYVDW